MTRIAFKSKSLITRSSYVIFDSQLEDVKRLPAGGTEKEYFGFKSHYVEFESLRVVDSKTDKELAALEQEITSLDLKIRVLREKKRGLLKRRFPRFLRLTRTEYEEAK